LRQATWYIHNVLYEQKRLASTVDFDKKKGQVEGDKTGGNDGVKNTAVLDSSERDFIKQ
jgi:hypothetical protein